MAKPETERAREQVLMGITIMQSAALAFLEEVQDEVYQFMDSLDSAQAALRAQIQKERAETVAAQRVDESEGE